MRRPILSGVVVVLPRASSRTATLFLSFFFGATTGAQSATRRVPQDFSTIQAAINAAQNGDTVLVSRGTYTGGLTISGKTITLASNYVNTSDPNDITQTIIDGGSPILTIQSSVGAATTVQGLTFRNGGHQLVNRARRVNILNNRFINGNDQVSFEGAGGLVRDCFFDNAGDDGIDADQASDPTIESNTILNSRNDGIEIRLHSYTGSTLNIVIRNNFISGAREDGIQLIDYAGLSSRLFRIERNVIVSNAMVGLGCMPDGISNENFGGAPLKEEVQVINNTFSGNPYGLTGGDNMLVMNNIFDSAAQIGVKRVAASSLVTDNDFWNNGTNYTGSNVNVNTTTFLDPLLDANYELQAGSPCIDAGTASIVWNGHTVVAPSYSGTAPDLGAHETTTQPGLPTVTVLATDPNAGEAGGNTGTFTVNRTGSTGASLTVRYTVGGTAAPGQDYTALSGSVTIAGGQSSAPVTITPVNDSSPEPTETVVVTLTARSSYRIGSPSSGTVTIADNDTATTTTLAFQDGVSPSSSYAGTRDTYISEPNPSSNFGTANVLKVDGDAGSGKDLSALLKWDLSSIPSGSLVQAVTLTIFVTDKSTHPYQVYELTRPWVENQATWRVYATGSKWSVAGAQGTLDRRSTVLGTVTASALGSYTLTLNSSGLDMVQSWVDTPSANNGIIVTNTTSSDVLVFNTRHVSTRANRPKLTVTYVGAAP